jgi:hypothetical protein
MEIKRKMINRLYLCRISFPCGGQGDEKMGILNFPRMEIRMKKEKKKETR